MKIISNLQRCRILKELQSFFIVSGILRLLFTMYQEYAKARERIRKCYTNAIERCACINNAVVQYAFLVMQ